jgi:hypothetical protein
MCWRYAKYSLITFIFFPRNRFFEIEEILYLLCDNESETLVSKS